MWRGVHALFIEASSSLSTPSPFVGSIPKRDTEVCVRMISAGHRPWADASCLSGHSSGGDTVPARVCARVRWVAFMDIPVTVWDCRARMKQGA